MFHIINSEWLLNILRNNTSRIVTYNTFSVPVLSKFIVPVMNTENFNIFYTNTVELSNEFYYRPKNCGYTYADVKGVPSLCVYDANDFREKYLKEIANFSVGKSSLDNSNRCSILGHTLFFYVDDLCFNICMDSNLLCRITKVSSIYMSRESIIFWVDNGYLYFALAVGVGQSELVTSIYDLTALFVFNLSNSELSDFVISNFNCSLVGDCELFYNSVTQTKLSMLSNYDNVLNGLFAGKLLGYGFQEDWYA